MATFRQIGPCLLMHGDARVLVPQLEEKADLLLTDPPYKLTAGGANGKAMSGIFKRENYNNSGNLMPSMPWSEVAGPMFEACKANADAYVMANDKNIFEAQAAFLKTGWKFHNLLTWHKGAPTRNRWYMKDLEFTIYLWKGHARTIRMPGSKQLFSCPRPEARFHQTEKPVALMEHYMLNSTAPGELVLDPFAGSASTLVAAMRQGRRAIGIELDRKWFDLAVERLESEWLRISNIRIDREKLNA